MLTITVPGVEYFDEVKQEFITIDETTLQLEHSLVSLSKWEAKWEKPFLSAEEKSDEEALDYIKAMVLTENVPPEIFQRFTNENIKTVNDYIEAKMSATWFTDSPNAKKNREIITAEIIYFWMFSHSLPLECENWHLSKLFTQLRVINQKNAPEKKMSKQEVANRNRALNEARKAKLNTKG